MFCAYRTVGDMNRQSDMTIFQMLIHTSGMENEMHSYTTILLSCTMTGKKGAQVGGPGFDAVLILRIVILNFSFCFR